MKFLTYHTDTWQHSTQLQPVQPTMTGPTGQNGHTWLKPRHNLLDAVANGESSHCLQHLHTTQDGAPIPTHTPADTPGKAAGHRGRSLHSVTCLGAPDGILGSWVQTGPGPEAADICGVNQSDRRHRSSMQRETYRGGLQESPHPRCST